MYDELSPMPLIILKGHDFSYIQNTNLLDMYILINFDFRNSYDKYS